MLSIFVLNVVAPSKTVKLLPKHDQMWKMALNLDLNLEKIKTAMFLEC
jgi:hypothetical protein